MVQTVQAPNGAWSPTIPTNGIGGQNRVADLYAGAMPGSYGYAAYSGGYAVPNVTCAPGAVGTVPQMFGQPSPVGFVNPINGGFATLPYPYPQFQTIPQFPVNYAMTPCVSTLPAGFVPTFGGMPYNHSFGYGLGLPFVVPQVAGLNAYNPYFGGVQGFGGQPFGVVTQQPQAWINPIGATTTTPIGTIPTINSIPTIQPFTASQPQFINRAVGTVGGAALTIDPFTGAVCCNPWLTGGVQSPFCHVGGLAYGPGGVGNLNPFAGTWPQPNLGQSLGFQTLNPYWNAHSPFTFGYTNGGHAAFANPFAANWNGSWQGALNNGLMPLTGIGQAHPGNAHGLTNPACGIC
jgi:hypothetical protein